MGPGDCGRRSKIDFKDVPTFGGLGEIKNGTSTWSFRGERMNWGMLLKHLTGKNKVGATSGRKAGHQ